MKDKTRRILIGVLIVILTLFAGFQLIFFFEKGPGNLFGIFVGELSGFLSIAVDLLFVFLIILSKEFIASHFADRTKWKFILTFLLLAIILDIYFEIMLQYSNPSFQILWVDLMLRFTFFLPWIGIWVITLYFFEFSPKELFFIAAIQGIIGEFLIAELFFPGFGMAAALGYNLFSIIIGGLLTILLYGCNLAAPYIAFNKSYEEKLNRSNSWIKYIIVVIPLIAFPIAFSFLLWGATNGWLLPLIT